MKKSVLSVAFAAIVAGCAPSYVNLTPRTVAPAPENVHLFEVQWSSPRTGANNPDVRAYVTIGTNFFPMARIPNTTDRWEAKVPLPPDATSVPYRYRFDYTYPGTPQRVSASDRSQEYFLRLPRK